MLIVVTGVSGSGKTTIMKHSSRVQAKQIFLDSWVKNHLYFRWQKGYKLIKKHFGKNYVNFWRVATYDLGKYVFSDPKKLRQLNNLIYPLVKKFLEKLNENSKDYIIEQATYLNHENDFKHYYKKVILVRRMQSLNTSEYTAVKAKKIKFDYSIKNSGKLEASVNEYRKIINDILT